MIKDKNINNLGVPVAIVIAGLIIAGAILYGGDGVNKPTNDTTTPTEDVSLDNIRKVSSKDYLKGTRGAPIKIVEYSDLECPFCKRFHQTVEEIQSEFGDNKVAWVFRHFPLDSLHRKARAEANALECAGKIGGNIAFWNYLDKIFDNTTSNDGLDLALLPDFAEQLGLNRNQFIACQDSNEFAEKVEADYQNAVASGGRGTPFPVIVVETRKNINLGDIIPASLLHSVSSDGKSAALRGAVPTASLSPLIANILEVI